MKSLLKCHLMICCAGGAALVDGVIAAVATSVLLLPRPLLLSLFGGRILVLILIDGKCAQLENESFQLSSDALGHSRRLDFIGRSTTTYNTPVHRRQRIANGRRHNTTRSSSGDERTFRHQTLSRRFGSRRRFFLFKWR